MSLWRTVAAERGALADDLANLTDAQWNTASLCEGWTVRQVLAHLTATASTTPVSFFTGLASSRFSFDTFLERNIKNHLGGDPAATLRQFRAVQNSTKAPPGPKVSWLGEVIVHGEDIRRPLGIAHDYPMDSVKEVFRSYAGSNLVIGAKSRLDGLQLVATDTDFVHGAGARVEGPMIALLLASTGRKDALKDLDGPGISVLHGR